MEQNKIRYGVIGIKGVGERHCLYAQQNTRAELAAIVDIDSDFLEKRSAELGIPAFTDYRDLLARGIVDAVSIATPHDHHFDIAQDCLNAGVHVHIEKPIAPRLTEANKLTALAKAKNLKISVGHQYRLFRLSQIIKRVVDAQTLGEIRRVLWTWGLFRPQRYYVHWPWKGAFRQVGSGLLGYHGIHDLDLICWIIGKPVQVTAFIGNHYHQAETEDFACANVLFANGAFGSLQFTINQPIGYSVRQIAGDKGILVMPDVKSLVYDETDELLLGTYDGELPKMMSQLTGVFDQPRISWHRLELSPDGSISAQPIIPPAPDDNSLLKNLTSAKNAWRWFGLARTHPNTHSTEHRIDPMCTLINNFIDAVLDEREPVVSGESTLPAVELMNALMLSAIRKKTVDLPIDQDEYDELFEELSSGKTQVPRFR